MRKLLFFLILVLTVLSTGCRKTTNPKTEDLSQTCFPLAVGCEWTYQRHNIGYRNWGESPEENWKRFDTFVVRVIGAEMVGDTVYYQLAGQGCQGYPGQVLDVSNPVRIWDNKVAVHIPGGNGFDTLVNLYDTGDRLRIEHSDGDTSGTWNEKVEIERIKGVGAVRQSYWYQEPSAMLDIQDRLIYFFNGKDTVYFWKGD